MGRALHSSSGAIDCARLFRCGYETTELRVSHCHKRQNSVGKAEGVSAIFPLIARVRWTVPPPLDVREGWKADRLLSSDASTLCPSFILEGRSLAVGKWPCHYTDVRRRYPKSDLSADQCLESFNKFDASNSVSSIAGIGRPYR